MSFFFIQHDRKKAKQPSKAKPSNVETLHRLQCKVCPLSHAKVYTPQMKPAFGSGPVYFLAEAPGHHEDEISHRPLTGPSGNLLRNVLVDCGVEPDDCTYDNVVNCHPPQNRTPVWQEMECCRPRRWQFVEQAKPKLIVGLGSIPAMAVLGSSDISGLRGRFFAVKVGNHTCWFMPTYHPSYILRNAKNKAKPMNSMLGHCLRMDIKHAFDAVRYLKVPIIDGDADAKADIEIFDGSGRFNDLLALMDRARVAKVKSVDLETRFLRPYSSGAGIMSCAVSIDGGVNFAFAADHPKALWTGAQKETILTSLAELLKDNTTKIAHNAPFEIEWLSWLYGPKIVNHMAWECTQMQAHFLDERKGGRHDDDNNRVSKYLSLDHLAKQHFGIAFKSLFKLNKKDMSKSPLDELLIYNAVDTKYTLRLWHHQNKLLKADGSYGAYQLTLPTQPTVALMQHIGVGVDQKAVKAASGKLGKQIQAVEFNISNLNVVQKFSSDKRENFNPGSQPQVLEMFKDYLKCPQVQINPNYSQVHDYDKPSAAKRGDQGGPRYSVDKTVLAQIDHPLARLVEQWRSYTKLKSTYVDGLSREQMEAGEDVVLYPDGRLHTNFNGTATETGRLSSDGPNLQNYPKRSDSWLRNQVIPPKGYTMLAVDYGQLEACTGAMCSRDTYLVKALWDDYDIHMDWAKLLDKEKPQLRGDLSMKQFRSLIKNKLVFPAFYGAANDSIAGYLSTAFGQEVTEQYIGTVMDRFWHVLSGMKRWQDKLVAQYYDKGWVATLGGRKHRYPLTRNQAINHPFQGTAAELVCDAMNRLSMRAVESGQWHLHPVLNIHDDLTFCVPNSDAAIADALAIIMEEMLVFDFPWVNVPLSLEISIGPNWADLEPIGKYWSHREFGYPSVTSSKIQTNQLRRSDRAAPGRQHADAGGDFQPAA